MNTYEDKSLIGFWLYLMTDLLIFAVLFATFAVLRNNTYGSITIHEIFDPPFVLAETLVLLTSSFTCGLAILYAHQAKKQKTIVWLLITLLFGLIFLFLEIKEFSHILSQGYSWKSSAFLSSFFTLIGTHGIHIVAGSLWITIMIVQILKRGITSGNSRKIILLSYFWHFLDIVWIFIFTLVYLVGGLI